MHSCQLLQHPNKPCAFRRTGNLWNRFSSIINTVGKRDDTYDNDDDDEADRIRADAKDIVNRAKYPKPDQDLIDAGFVATRDPNSDTGWSYENPNVVEDDTTGLNIVNGSDFNKTIITDPNELDTGLDDPYASYGKVTIGYGGSGG